MYFFFDTETTGLPKNWKAPVTDVNNWPRMIQVGYIIYDQTGQPLNTKEYIIRPDGFIIPEEASNIHGVTTERAMDEGLPLYGVLEELHAEITKSSMLVAHNISYDENILGAEFLRENFNNIIPAKKRFCTMKSSVDYCALPGRYGYKWPNLQELHTKLFNQRFEGAHNALADIKATADCFWRMKELNIIQP
ncbi:MAG TPA: 3'-5' exonuclease [Chitinophagales bacterium]|nr:3'-5' exonuclease [Chitinophagales bacterium]